MQVCEISLDRLAIFRALTASQHILLFPSQTGRKLCQVVELLSGRAIGLGQISTGLGSILDFGARPRSSLIQRTEVYISRIFG
jgi:hypothetical protein